MRPQVCARLLRALPIGAIPQSRDASARAPLEVVPLEIGVIALRLAADLRAERGDVGDLPGLDDLAVK